MTISRAKQAQLKAVFSSLPRSISTRLFEVFETAKKGGDTSLPYGVLLDLFPAKLSRSDVDLIFFPISELIADDVMRADQVSFELLCDIWNMYVDSIGSKNANNWQDDVSSLRKHQATMSEKLRIKWEEEGGIADLTSRFGEENIAKIRLVFTVMAFAEEVSELLSRLPEEIKDLDDRYLLPLRDLNDLLVDNEPDITPYLLFLLKVRLRHPQQILRAIERLSRQNTDVVIVNTDMNVIVEVLLDEADALLAKADEEIVSVEQIEQMASDLLRFGNIITGSTEEFNISSDSSWGKRLFGISNKAVQFWTRRANETWKLIDKALPRTRTKSFLGGSLTGSDVEVVVDVELVEKAVLNTQLLTTVFAYAPRVGFSAARDSFNDSVNERLREQESSLIDMLADPGEFDIALIQSHFSVLVKINSAFHGDEAASILSRRGASALASVA